MQRVCFQLQVKPERLEEYEDAVAGMAATQVNQRWQDEMAEFFSDLGAARPDTGFLRLREVFHLEDQLPLAPRRISTNHVDQPEK
jgi:L-rhamnose mutarotase